MHWYVLIATLAPMLIYCVVGFRNSPVRTEAEYYLDDQKVSPSDFANISVGYALQMAAVFLFAAWGMLYGVGALWTAIFWMVGYAVQYLLVPRFADFRAKSGKLTLHEYLRKSYANSRGVHVTSAMATAISLLGTLIAEVDYTSQVYAPVWPYQPYFLQFAFLVLGASYVVWNGFRAEVKSERWQVPIAYLGLLTMLLAALPAVWRVSGAKPFWWIAGTVGGAMVLVLCGRVYLARRSKVVAIETWLPLAALVLLVAVVWHSVQAPQGSVPTVFDKPISEQLVAQGLLGLFSLFLANALWMPVDISTWQRVAALGDHEVETLRSVTVRVLLESPATWCLGAALGWAISAGGFVPKDVDPYAAVASLATTLTDASKGNPSWIYPVFVAGCVAIMLSTVNALLSALAFTTDRDLLPAQKEDLSQARMVTAGILIGGFVAYHAIRSASGANIGLLLYGAYAAQLSLFWAVWFALMGSRLNAYAALMSICAGIFGTVLVTCAAIWRDSDQYLSVMPPFFALAFSGVTYIFILRFRPQSNAAL